jgi:hypothetical protein
LPPASFFKGIGATLGSALETAGGGLLGMRLDV